MTFRYYVERKRKDPWKELGKNWKEALTNPYYILAWQVLLLLIIYES